MPGARPNTTNFPKMHASVARNRIIHTPTSLIVIDGAGIPMEIPNAQIESCAAIPTIRGLGHRPVKVSSLRPGDVIGLEEWRYVVQINSAKERRIVLRDRVSELSIGYVAITENYFFIRHQKKRAWPALLPQWIRKNISPYPSP
jgi:hypothetical protein